MEEIKVAGGNLKAKIKEIIREGNIRRIVIRNPQGRTLLDLPLSAGVAGAALLPFWAAIGKRPQNHACRAALSLHGFRLWLQSWTQIGRAHV